jgi:hypothetical protein
MFVRSAISEKKTLSLIGAICLLVVAGVCLAYQFWPQRKVNHDIMFFSDDDGQTWFKDSFYQVPPFDHNGKTAVIAEVYSYDNGSKEFCAYLAKYTPEAKKKLEAALADATANNQPVGNVSLYHDHGFIDSGMLVKLPGPNQPWILFSDPRASTVFSIHSPDGSAVDQVLVY